MPENNDYYVLGNFNNWTVAAAYKMTQRDINTYVLFNKEFSSGDRLKVHLDNTDVWYSNASTWPDCGFSIDQDGNVVILDAGEYNITLHLDGANNNYITLDNPTPLPAISASSFHTIKVVDNNDYITLSIDGISYDIEKDTSSAQE